MFKPEDFLKKELKEILQPFAEWQRIAAVSIANAKHEAECPYKLTKAEINIIESWKRDELIWIEQEKTLHAQLDEAKTILETLCEEKGCSYCNDCAPCGSGFGDIKANALAFLEKLK